MDFKDIGPRKGNLILVRYLKCKLFSITSIINDCGDAFLLWASNKLNVVGMLGMVEKLLSGGPES